MKQVKILLLLLLCLFFNLIQAQKTKNCVYCNMIINDEYHKASAQYNGTVLYFDSSECLINYNKKHPEISTYTFKVANYTTGEYIEANQAFYLISNAIPSPMGANISAFNSKEEALKIKNEKGGEIYSWETLNAKFKNIKVGALNHHNHHDHYRPDAHAPIGIMGDHLHAKGGLMLSFRYMNMLMNGNKAGTKEIADTSIYDTYMVAPKDMVMNMYMLGVMYAPSNNVTLMAMQNVISKNMNLTANMMMNGMATLRDFSTTSSAFGDLLVGAIYGLFNNHKSSLHLNVSLNLPVGDITNRDDTPMMTNAKLPYAMQTGSGTFDITLGATFKKSYTNTSLGAQYLSTFRTGNNSENYRFGDIHQLNIWGAYRISTNLSVSARILGDTKGRIKGLDSDLNPMTVTTANINNYGSEKIKSFIGFNVSFPPSSTLKRFRLGFEFGTPLYEYYHGIQMNENLSINSGLKYDIL